MKENNLYIISPFYNAENYIEKCINSVLSQKYKNYIHIIIDDNSKDNSSNIIKDNYLKGSEIIEKEDYFIYKLERLIYVKNKKRKGALYNIVFALENFCEDKNSIICSLDGDDWLYNRDVFSYINKVFEKNDNYIMYGGCSWTDGNSCCSRPYDEYSFKNIRNGRQFYLISQMRCFRKFIFDELKKQDPMLNSLKNKDGLFYKITHDVALYLPLFEISGLNKIIHNKKIIYTYNRDNPINDDKVNQKLQWDIHDEINKKEKFKKIKNYE